MCYIAVLKPGAPVPDTAIRSAARTNDDGVGIAYPAASGGVYFFRGRGSEIVTSRAGDVDPLLEGVPGYYGRVGYNRVDEKWPELDRALKMLDAAKIASWRLIHLRAVSSGEHSVSQSHPFPLELRKLHKGATEGTTPSILAHNGTVQMSEWLPMLVQIGIRTKNCPARGVSWSDTLALAWAAATLPPEPREQMLIGAAKTYGRLIYGTASGVRILGGPWFKKSWGVSNYDSWECQSDKEKVEKEEKADAGIILTAPPVDSLTTHGGCGTTSAQSPSVENIIKKYSAQSELDGLRKLPMHYKRDLVQRNHEKEPDTQEIGGEGGCA